MKTRTPTVSVRHVHFEDFDGHEFERLALAYFIRKGNCKTVEWYGETGADVGRDIWMVEQDGNTVCVQCANRKQLTFRKVAHDLGRIEAGEHGLPKKFIVISGASVSAGLRTRVKKAATDKGIIQSEVWSGAEFEEMLRTDAESLLKRFVNGETFPDSPDEMKGFVASGNRVSDEDILKGMIPVFDRAAFYTPFHCESNLGDFRQAITDSIEAINTGVRHTRKGDSLPKIGTRHDVQNPVLREQLRRIELKLANIRATYDRLLRTRDLKPCQCGDPKCSSGEMSPKAIHELDALRTELLDDFRKLYPEFSVRVGF